MGAPRCTWLNCQSLGCKEWLDKQGHRWALLCIPHDMQLKRELEESTKIERLISAWVNAQGGSKKAAERI